MVSAAEGNNSETEASGTVDEVKQYPCADIRQVFPLHFSVHDRLRTKHLNWNFQLPQIYERGKKNGKEAHFSKGLYEHF